MNTKNNVDEIKDPNIMEPRKGVINKESDDIKIEDKIDPSTVPTKSPSSSKFIHITKKKNILTNNMNKNNNKNRFDSADYCLKKQGEKKN